LDAILDLAPFDSNLAQQIQETPDLENYLSIHQELQEFKDILLQSTNLHEDLERFEQLISTPQKFDPSRVNLMSIHKSKGLQADHVFILGLVDGILPRNSTDLSALEAERRLLFVAMSRVKQKLHPISQIEWPSKYSFLVDKQKFKFRGKKKVAGRTSRFISELS